MTHYASPLPFRSLCDVLLPLLIGTGHHGRRAIERLLSLHGKGFSQHLGQSHLTTPAGTLRINATNTNNKRLLDISLQISPTLGYIHGEVYTRKVVVPASIGAAVIGQPLSKLCETPDAFPGKDRIIRNVRTFTRSTRIKIESKTMTVSLDDIHLPRRQNKKPFKIDGTSFDMIGFELKRLGEAQTLTFRVEWDERVTLGPGTIIEVLPWSPGHDRITQIYDPVTRKRYHLTDT